MNPARPKGKGKEAAIRHLRQALAQGRPWFLALLEAIGLWTDPEEVYKGRKFCYLVGGVAFDWLLLAERLSYEADDIIPEQELQALLLRGQPPLKISRDEFKRLIGLAKYRAFLNYFYGVVVEEALQEAVAEEVRKARLGWPGGEEEVWEEVFHRLYSSSQEELLKQFRREKRLPLRRSLALEEAKEFTYWLFRYRVEHNEKARVASDTKKGLEYLCRFRSRILPG